MRCIGFIDEKVADQILLNAKTIFNLTTGYIVKARKLKNDSWDFFESEKPYDLCKNNFPNFLNIDIPVRQNSYGNLFLEFVNWNDDSEYLQILDENINLQNCLTSIALYPFGFKKMVDI